MDNQERRKYERISKTDLPLVFKTLLVDLGESVHVPADTVDVSTTGIGVSLSLPQGVPVRMDQIALHSSDNTHEFSGQIVHAERLREDQYRLGVVLRD
jgi:hypothetical protein